MSSDEEYLDSLLKSIAENEEEADHLTAEDNTEIPENNDQDMNDFAIEDFGEEEPSEETPDEEENPDNIVEPEERKAEADDLAIEDYGEEELPTDAGSMDDLDDMEDSAGKDESLDNDFAIQDLGEEEPPVGLEEDEEENSKETAAMKGDSSQTMSPDDIDAMFAAADVAASQSPKAETGSKSTEDKTGEDALDDDELAEISGLLKQSGNDGMTDDDMLALLESMSPDSDGSEKEKKEEKKEAEEKPAEDGEKIPDNAEDTEKSNKKEKKKLFSGLLGRKKKKETENGAETEDAEFVNPEENKDFDLPVEPKKKNFFTKIFSFLTETDEKETDEKTGETGGMEPSDENRSILEELDEEDKKKKKKKVKGRKEKVEPKEDEEEDEEEPPKKSRKKRKVKKTDTEEAVLAETKPGKKISPKNVGVIAGLCITLAAVILVFSSVIPGFFDKRDARSAYYQADYAKSYELLYGKKLDESDSIIFNKSKTILEMNRKLDSYHNYISMNMEIQALDALISGVEHYPAIYAEAEEYHVTQEVKAIYDTLVTILYDKFGISEEQAKEIIGYDDLTYTKKLESIINGTPFVLPAAEADGENGTDAAAEIPARTETDILPEEQDILTQELPAEDTAPAEELPTEDTEETNATQEAVEADSAVEPDNSGTVEDSSTAPEDTTDGSATQENSAAQDDSAAQNAQPQTQSQSQGELIQGLRQPLEININE